MLKLFAIVLSALFVAGCIAIFITSPCVGTALAVVASVVVSPVI